jgi:hypothetical protein
VAPSTENGHFGVHRVLEAPPGEALRVPQERHPAAAKLVRNEAIWTYEYDDIEQGLNQ